MKQQKNIRIKMKYLVILTIIGLSLSATDKATCTATGPEFGPCTTCTTSTAANCDACDAGYVLGAATPAAEGCLKCEVKGCLECVLANKADQCTKCDVNNGYKLDGTTCTWGATGCSVIDGWTSTGSGSSIVYTWKCTACQDGFFLDGTVCTACTDATKSNADCGTCDKPASGAATADNKAVCKTLETGTTGKSIISGAVTACTVTDCDTCTTCKGTKKSNTAGDKCEADTRALTPTAQTSRTSLP